MKKLNIMFFTAIVLSLSIIGFSFVSVAADSNGLAIYVNNDWTLSGGQEVAYGDVVVLGSVNGLNWVNRFFEGKLYADKSKIAEYKNVEQAKVIDKYLSSNPYSFQAPVINVQLKDFPSLPSMGSLSEANEVNITQSGWYDSINIKNNGKAGLMVTADEGEVIEIRVDNLNVENDITVNGSGTVLFYVNNISASGNNDPRINENGNASVGFYFADGNVSLTNVTGNFSMYSKNSNITISGSSYIIGNVYLNGSIKLQGSSKIVGYVGGNDLYADLSGGIGENVGNEWRNVVIEGRLVADNVLMTGGPVVKNGNVTDINSGLAKKFAPSAPPEEPSDEYVNGLKAEYFDAQEVSNDSAIRKIQIDPRPFFNWKYDSPDISVIEPETFAVRWSGFIKPESSQEYIFKILSDDGVRLFVDGEKIIDRWGLVNLDYTSSDAVFLEADKYYPITLEYQQIPFYSLIYLFWETEEDGISSIPANMFYVSKQEYEKYKTPVYNDIISANGTGLKVEFYNTETDFKAGNPDYSEISAVNYHWGIDNPPNITNDVFYALMEGYIEPKYTEELTLSFEVDDAIKVWVDDNLIIESWKENSREFVEGKFNAVAGKKSKIKIEYADLGGGATCSMRWGSEIQSVEVIPEKYLYSE